MTFAYYAPTLDMQFREIVGQTAIKKGFLRVWESGQLPHALLIAGREGTGGLPFALAVAQYVFCNNRTAEDACGLCAGCRKARKLEHADLHLSFPSIAPKPNTKALSRYYLQAFREFVAQTPYGSSYDWLQFIGAENKQGNITAEECRNIIETLNLKSYEGGMKVQLIWRPEYLGKEGNILLKMIEEPPPDTLILLVAEDPEALLPTILSRTQMLRLAPVGEHDIAAALVGHNLADERKAMQIAHIASGSYAEALRLIQHTENDLFPDVRRWFNALFTGNNPELSKLAEEWAKNGREQQKNMLHYVIQLLGQTIRTRFIPGAVPALPDEEAQFVHKLAAMPLAFEVLEQMIHAVTETIHHIERNAHSRAQLHALSIRLKEMI